MIKITQVQASERWDALPEALREALYLETNSDFVWKTCEGEHIPDQKIYTVSRIVGYVLMGFLHPEDMAAEIADVLKIDKRIADSLANAINQRIFAPIRQDIDKVYGPPGSENIGPKIFQEIKPAAASASAPATSLQKPASLPAKGWSGIPTIVASAQTPAAAPQPKPVGEFERLSAMKTTTAGSGSVAPAPTIIQSAVSAPKPIQNAPDFRSPSIAQNMMGNMKTSVPLPPRPAVIELGNKTDVPRVIHYGELTSSLPTAMPTGNKPPVAESGRKLTEITPAAISAMKPTPIPVPMPPKPPEKMPPRPIIKDFLDRK